MARLGLIAVALALLQLAAAQASSSQPSSSSGRTNTPSPTANVTSIVTSIPVVTSTSVSGSRTISFSSLSASTIISTISARPTGSSNTTNHTTSTGHNSTTTQETGPVLDTHIGPAFGVLGALLLLTGLPSAFLGHKNRWSSFFLTGFYTLSLICLALILRFGVLVAIHPPTEKLKGLFVLACGVAGIAGGGVSIFFWQQTKYFIGAWGGFAIGLWVQCFRNGGLIGPIGFRWIMYAACTTVGFVICTIPKLHYHVMILGTAITGASAFMLGVDCFTTAGLKEFYVYNIGFSALFPKFNGIKFPVSQTMQIEIGLIAAVALSGTAVQHRVLRILKRKLREINEEEKRREVVAEDKAVKRFEHVQRDLDEWEKEHGKDKSKPMSESELSAVPLMTKEQDESTHEESTTIGHQRTRTRSGLSEYALNNDPSRPVSRFSQSPGILPAMNLGFSLDSELPGELVSDDLKYKDPELVKKEELLAEIQTIRRSIDALRSDTGSASGESRRHSMSLHSRTLSGDLAAIAEARVATMPRAGPSRDRVHSMNILESPFEGKPPGRVSQGAAIVRPVSAPLDDDWEAYVRERKLFQPPAGPSAPIAPTYVTPIPQPAPAFHPVSDAVAQALAGRRQRESVLDIGLPPNATADDLPIGAKRTSRVAPVDVAPKAHRRTSSLGPVNVLPPRQKPATEQQSAPRTVTYEELLERHQAKMRSLQEPISRQEKEQVELDAARRRWERSKTAEREAQARKQVEKEATLTKKVKEEPRHSREVLGEGSSRPSGGRRASTGKVLEWQRYQQETTGKDADAPKESTRRRGRPPAEQGGLPFPNTTPRVASGTDKRRSRGGIPPS